MKKIEYKVLEFKERRIGGYFKTEVLQLALNKLGVEGWEIVSVTPHRTFLGATIALIYTLKKETNI